MRFPARIAGALAATIALAGLAHANAPADTWYVAPQALWVDPQHADSATGWRAAVGKSISENWDGELAYASTKHGSGLAGTGDLKLNLIEADAKRVWNRDQRFSPFIEFGLGMLDSGFQGGSSKTRAAAKAGVGALWALGSDPRSKLALIGDHGLRVEDGVHGNTAIDPFVGLGLRFAFGGAAPAPAPKAALAMPPPAAPAPVAAPPPPAPLDSDDDGVVDSADQCPATPAGARVDARGCELDGDRDGVVDRLDKCPATPAGDKVDAQGCSLTMPLLVQFDTAKATLKAVSFPELDAFVAFLKAVPSAAGELQGHTDNVGKAAYNLKLSQDRADAVKAYVVGKGIDAARLTAKGYGLTQPVADNKTAEGRTQNRRVLFVRN